MIINLCSIARKAGSFQNDRGNTIEYDNIILYCLIPLETYSGKTTKLEGSPVSLTEVKIPVKNYNDICNIPYDDLNNYIGCAVEVYYDMKIFDGKPRPTLSKVVF